MANEKRLIDANALKAIFDERYDTAFVQERTRENKEHWNGYCTGVNWGRNTIADAPTVDAVEVVHGRWVHIVEDGKGGCYGFCSRCSTEHHADSASALKAFHRYCRWCGADMRERSE